jgi:glycosyltransferase involved in cell wall biosynthesis
VARICIVTPGQVGANPRVVKEADALHAAGHIVNVIATRMMKHVEPRDLEVMRRRSWNVCRIDLRSRLRWKALRLRQIGWRHAYRATCIPYSADFALRAYTQPLRAAALATPADLYVAHYPDALPAVAAAARSHGGRYAYDAEDFHLGDWRDDPVYEIERRLVREIEGRHLPDCAYITASSPGIADAYADTYGLLRPVVVLNTFPRSQAPLAPNPRGTAEPGPSLYWFSQTLGPDRGLECAVRAIGIARTRPHLYLRGTLDAAFGERLRDLAQATGVAEHIHLLPPDAPDKMEELAAIHDAGLAGETSLTANHRVCLANKVFTYLLAGVPPLLSDTPAQSRFAAEAGLSNLVYPQENPVGLAALIDRLLGDPATLAATRAQAWRLGQERYNWECESRHLVEAVARAGFSPSSSAVVASGLGPPAA